MSTAAVDEVPASVAQRLCWVLEQFRGADGATNCPIVLRLRGRLDVDRIGAGLDRLTAKHESLRTTFAGRGRRLMQVINEPRPLEVPTVDLSGTADPPAALEAALVEEIHRPIDATAWPVRTTLWRLGPCDHALCLNMHHLVTDGWSCGLVLRDLAALSHHPGNEGGADERSNGWQYRQFSAWQQAWLGSDASRADRDYWRKQLENACLPDLPLIGPRRVGAYLEGGSITADIPAETVVALGREARAQRATLPSLMLAAYYVVLGRVTGQRDLSVASFLANRARPEASETVGLLANMILLRADLSAATSFADVVRAAHATLMDAYVHQSLPYQLLPADSLTQGDRRPDDVVFQMVPRSTGGHQVAGAAAEAIVVDHLGTRFECELQLYPTENGLRVVVFYNRARLDNRLAQQLLDGFVALVTAASSRPSRRLLELW